MAHAISARWIRGACLAMLFALAGAGILPAQFGGSLFAASNSSQVTTGSEPAYDHVVIVLMENRDYSYILGNPKTPYINNTLIPKGALATNYDALAHPSLPNYLTLTAGSQLGVTTNCNPSACPQTAPTIATSVVTAGKTWKAYQESMPSNCYKSDSGNYLAHHNPFAYFTNLPSCATNDVPYTQLASDFASASTTPAYSFITPNAMDSMDNGSTLQGDTWLSQNVPTILNSPAFTQQHSLLVVVWDENGSNKAPNQVPCIFVGYGVSIGARDATLYTHYSLLRTIEAGLSLPTLTSNDANATQMNGMFSAAPTPTPAPTATATATSSPTATATPTSTSTATPTFTPLPTPTSTPAPPSTPLPTPTSTPVPTPTSTPIPTPTVTPLPTPTSTPLPTPTPTVTPSPTPSPTPAPTVTPAPSDPVVVAVGDISCDPADPNYNGGNGTSTSCQAKYTAAEVGGAQYVLALGDQQYVCANLANYQNVYAMYWGIYKAITYPAAGNHEYEYDCSYSTASDAGASGYYTYFTSLRASPLSVQPCTSWCKGYYSYNIGTWHVIVLNSECGTVGGCQAGSDQELWLKSDLAANPMACTLVYWHRPYYSSGWGGGDAEMHDIWSDLYTANVDLVLNGHDHHYERFLPQDANSNYDPTHGVVEFVVGTGGVNLESFNGAIANSAVENYSTFGVLKLTLHANSYDWQFIPDGHSGSFTDSGSAVCH